MTKGDLSKRWHAVRASATAGAVLAMLVCCASAHAGLAEPQSIPLAVFQQQVVNAEQVVAGCAVVASACNAGTLPATLESVSRGPGERAFLANWAWLREAIGDAKTGAAEDRTRNMQAARVHLAEWTAQPEDVGALRADGAATTGFAQARTIANRVLARSEFRAAEGPSWLDRQVARVQDWISRLFMGMMGIGSRNAWLAPAVEWSCFLLAAAGLLFFVRRNLQRQSLRIALGEGAAAARRTDRDAADWARLAEERAAAGDWREAIHCLYWAAIAALEARRAWRFNPTRTPREYLRLLRPGSEAERGLNALTQIFERIWYGQGEATEDEFRAAQASFAAIQAADLKRGGQGTTAAAIPVEAA